MKIRDLKTKVARDIRFARYLEVVDNPSFQKRIREIDDGYIAMFNWKSKRYEIHSFGPGVETLSIVVPWMALDDRTVRKLWETSYKFHDVGKKMREYNKRLKESKDRDFDREIEARAIETGKEVGDAMVKDMQGYGYHKTHVM